MKNMDESQSSPNTITLGQKLVTNEPFAYNTLIRIFRYLNLKDLLNCAHICPIWQWISCDDTLWKHIDVITCPQHIHKPLDLYYSKIQNLEILDSKLLSLFTFEELCSKMENLQQISLHGCHMEQLRILAKNCMKIKRIYAEIHLGQDAIMDFIGSFQDLAHIDLIIKDSTISDATFLKHLKQLKHLSLSACCEENVWKEVAKVDNLESLSLCTDSCSTGFSRLFESNSNIRHLKNLRKLHVTGLPYDYETLDKIKSLPNIKELVLENISISRAGTSNFARTLGQCNNIEKLTISINRIVFYNNILDVALENTEILNGVIALKNNLKYFCWLMDEAGMSKAFEFYHKYNITAIKTIQKHRRLHASRTPNAVEVVPIPLPKLLKIFQDKLPKAEVLLLDPETVERSRDSKSCYECGKKIRTARRQISGYS